MRPELVPRHGERLEVGRLDGLGSWPRGREVEVAGFDEKLHDIRGYVANGKLVTR